MLRALSIIAGFAWPVSKLIVGIIGGIRGVRACNKRVSESLIMQVGR